MTGGTRFIKNEAVDNGGVFYVSGSETSLVIKKDTLFKGNVAMRRGGAVYINHAQKLAIENASFVDNEAKDFGGGAVFAEVGSSCFSAGGQCPLIAGFERERDDDRRF